MGILSRNKEQIEPLATLDDINLALQRVSGAEANRYFDAQGRRKGTNMRPEDKERIYFFETQVMSNINKSASKMFHNWFDMDDPRGSYTMDEKTRDDLELFHESIELKTKKIAQAIDAMIHGNGFLELIPERPLIDSRIPITPNMGLKDVVMVDPAFIMHKIEPVPNRPNEFYYLEIQKDYQIKRIHNSRIDHVKWITAGTMPFGRGVIEVGLRTFIEKMKMDWALGEIIFRFGKPFLVLKTTGATKKEIPYALNLLQKINPTTGFAGTEKHDFQILNPEAIDPQPYADFYYKNMAAALEMPLFEFIGAQRGQVTGGEVDLAGWHDILLSKLGQKFTTGINRINNFYLKGNWKDKIYWNKIYVDEESQTKIEKVIAETVEILYNKAGVVENDEIRQYLRNKGFDWVKEENDEANIPDEDEDEESPDESPFPFLPTITRKEHTPSNMDLVRARIEKKLGEEIIDEGGA